LAGLLDALAGPTDDLLLGHLQLELAMDGAGGEEDMDAAARGVAERLAGARDVSPVATGQAADHRPLHLAGNRLHRFEVARRSNGEAGLDDVHPQVGQRPGYLELLAEVHARAGGLLAVAERRVEDDQLVAGHESNSIKSTKSEGPGTTQVRGRVQRRCKMPAENAA